MTNARRRRIAALRKLIERGGLCTACGRRDIGATILFGVLVGELTLFAKGFYLVIGGVGLTPAVAARVIAAGLAGPLLAIAAVRLLAVHFRALYARGLRHHLASLPAEDQAAVLCAAEDTLASETAQIPAVLRPLLDHPKSDARKIAASLARGLNHRTGQPAELSPADVPTGRGDEPTATG